MPIVSVARETTVKPGARLSARTANRASASTESTTVRIDPSATLLILTGRVLRPPPETRHHLLPRPDLVERVGIVEAAVLHHVLERVGVLDVVERILVEHLKVRQLPRLQRADIVLGPDRFR